MVFQPRQGAKTKRLVMRKKSAILSTIIINNPKVITSQSAKVLITTENRRCPHENEGLKNSLNHDMQNKTSSA